MNVSQIAKRAGISRVTLYKWRDEHGLDITDLDAVIEMCKDREVGNYSGYDDDDVVEAKKRKAIFDAEKSEWDAKIKELKAAKEEGSLIDKDEVKETLTGIATRTKQRFLSLSGELPPKVAGLTPEETQKVLEREIGKVLEELGKEFSAYE